MQPAVPSLALMIFLFCLPLSLSAQSKQPQLAATATVSGQVTLDGKPAQGVVVILLPKNSGSQSQPLAKVTTDAQGRFRLAKIAAGAYVIRTLAPGFVSSETQNYEQGKSLILDEGETVNAVDFSLGRGAVITGRVEDDRHQPIIETYVELHRFDEQNHNLPLFNFNPNAARTDDRGIYRIFGLPAGRYKVSVGRAANDGGRVGGQANSYLRTYHPDVTDESRAEIIEVNEGEEAANIDITVTSTLKTFTAKGRIVDGESGRPVANVMYGYGTIIESYGNSSGKVIGGTGTLGNRTTSRGEFTLDELLPGRYAVMVLDDGTLEGFAEPTYFEIKDADVNGLEIKFRNGASIRGEAVIEGTHDPQILSLLPNVLLRVTWTPPIEMNGFMRPSKVADDGSFRIGGLRSGKARIVILANNQKRLTLIRMEHNGVEKKEIDLKPGEPVTGVRLVLGYGSGVIRGQINFENEPMPEGARYVVAARHLKQDSLLSPDSVFVDARGRFVITGVFPGEYEVHLLGTGLPQAFKQIVKVTQNAETQVTFVIDAHGKTKEERDNENR